MERSEQIQDILEIESTGVRDKLDVGGSKRRYDGRCVQLCG